MQIRCQALSAESSRKHAAIKSVSRLAIIAQGEAFEFLVAMPAGFVMRKSRLGRGGI